MDLSPFSFIAPCGNPKLLMTQISDIIPNITLDQIQPILIDNFTYINNYNHTIWSDIL